MKKLFHVLVVVMLAAMAACTTTGESKCKQNECSADSVPVR